MYFGRVAPDLGQVRENLGSGWVTEFFPGPSCPQGRSKAFNFGSSGKAKIPGCRVPHPSVSRVRALTFSRGGWRRSKAVRRTGGRRGVPGAPKLGGRVFESQLLSDEVSGCGKGPGLLF